ncbi:BACON domain-containing protein [Maribellus maritimus]|uniref:BACON domain-containing protein n=1 Tax=Maribellus maritimus TaxID=2870838 RepID=UPI001EEBA16B|nr:hypothetical protein [Maribellus maritimus]MCG6190802.1 hypothetical protein [Maribellus maritimus]
MKTFYTKRNISALRNLVLFSILSFVVISCGNEFLDTQMPSNYIDGDSIVVMSDVGSFEYEFDMLSAGPGDWKLFQFPIWLDISPKDGMLNGNSRVNFQFTVNKQEMYVDLGLYAFPLIFDVENVGLVENTVVLANVGEPEINETPSEINADYTFKGQYQIVNSGHGILMWQVVHKPNWLQLNVTEGILNSHEYGIWDYSIDPSGFEAGEYSGQVEIQSNASEQNFIINFNFTIQETGYYGGYLSGEYLDARFSKSLNQVIVLTREPNNLLFFKAGSSDADTVKLNKVPKCLALSEDEQTLAVGFSDASISTFETQSRTLLMNYALNAVADQIEFGSENRLYFLARNDYTTFLYTLDLQNSLIKKSISSNNGLSTLKKVPGKNLMISTRKGWSPDGLFVFDITNGALDSLNEYWSSLNGFWLSENGEHLFTGSQNVYQIPEYLPGQVWIVNSPPAAGEFNIGDGLKINDMVHQSSAGKLFIAYEEGYYRSTTYIKQLNDQKYTIQKTYEASPTPPDFYPAGNTWWVETLKLFPAPNGEELWIIRKYPADDYELPDMWTIERIDIN